MQPERTRRMDSGWRGTRNVVVVVCGTVACCLWTRAQPGERAMRDIEQRLVIVYDSCEIEEYAYLIDL